MNKNKKFDGWRFHFLIPTTNKITKANLFSEPPQRKSVALSMQFLGLLLVAKVQFSFFINNGYCIPMETFLFKCFNLSLLFYL